MSSTANWRQVGGTHYAAGTSYQHWDLVADADLDYFTAQITRYITRWRKKHGVEDVEKAIHYYDKLVELRTEGRARPAHVKNYPFLPLQLFFKHNRLSALEREIFGKLVQDAYGMNELRNVRPLLESLLATAKKESENASKSK